MNQEKELDALIIDGYVDEPSTLGVPPYLAPEPRYIAGALEEKSLNWNYLTIDELRKTNIPKTKNLLVYGGVTVPGKYLAGTPMTKQEAKKLAQTNATTYIAGPLARYNKITGYDYKIKKDLSASFYDHLKNKKTDRWIKPHERERWAQKSSEIIKKHPYSPHHLMIEIELYRGCPRYYTDGCSFCSEPYYGKPVFREQKDVSNEIKAIYEKNVKHYRIGAQSCTISYKAKDIGKKDPPEPVPQKIKKLFNEIWKKAPEIKVLHLDNANPAIIAQYPKKSKKILKTLVNKTTSGNVLAFGLETADKEVIRKNNLNTTPKQTKKAIKLVNEVGRERGENGLPQLLPGINFLGGLKAEKPKTYEKNLKFLNEVLEQDLWLRRINIRKILSHKKEFEISHEKEYKKFKRKTREEIDKPMLKKVLPKATILENVLLEKNRGKKTLGRQIATYPILVVINQELETKQFIDAAITDHGYRSVTAVKYPIKLKDASLKELQNLPGIGKKRAANIFTKKPRTKKELKEVIPDLDQVKKLTQFFEF